MSMWDIVSTVTRNLDEAAGLNAAPTDAQAGPSGPSEPSATPPREKVSKDGWDEFESDGSGSEAAPHAPQPVPNRAPTEGVVGPDLPLPTISGAQPLSDVDEQRVAPTATEEEGSALAPEEPTVAAPASSSEVTHLREQCERLSDALSRVSRECDALRNAPAADREMEQRLLAEGRELSTKLHKERERSKALVAERKATEDRHTALEAEFEALKETLLGAQESHRLAVSETDRQRERCASLEQQIQVHLHSLDAASVEAHSTKEEVRRVAAEAAALQEEHSKQQEMRLEEAVARGAAAEQSVASLQDQLRRTVIDAERRFASYERDLAAFTERAHAAEAKNAEQTAVATESAVDLQSEFHRYEQRIVAADAARAAAVNDVQDLRIELQAARTELTKSKASNSETLTAFQAELRESVRAREQRILSLERSLALARQEADSLRTAKRGVESTLRTTEASLAASKRKLNEAVTPSATAPSVQVVASSDRDLRREAARTAVNAVATRSETAQLQKALQDLNAQHDMLLQMYGQLQEEHNDLQEKSAVSQAAFRQQLEALAAQVSA